MKYTENKLTSVNVNDNNRKEFKKLAIDEEISKVSQYSFRDVYY